MPRSPGCGTGAPNELSPLSTNRCEGQIVRLERADAHSPWVLHVVESSGEERDEGAVEDIKLEL